MDNPPDRGTRYFPSCWISDSRTPEEQSCWVTLITRPSYLPGVIVLAHSLDKQKSKYPLLVYYTSSLGKEAGAALLEEAKRTDRIRTVLTELMLPRKEQENTASVAGRFKDTFTKLRAFEIYKLGYSKCVFLDADMAVLKNPDSLFDQELPDRDWIGANHACVCNLDHDSWAQEDWNKGNCAYTTLTGPDQVAAEITDKSRPTYHLFNSGMFLYYPSEESWTKMLDLFNTTEKLKGYQFPDQDFLIDYFRNKWQPLSWRYNAIKTMRYWHPKLWSDKEVTILHYIVDKPWERQVSLDGVAGHLGRDGETHRWWWDLYYDWRKEETKPGGSEPVVKAMKRLVDTQEPFTEKVPLPQEPGKPEDVKAQPEPNGA